MPPAYRSAPDTAIASTPEKVPLTPEPSAVQLVPSHLAVLVAALPPVVENLPPAYRVAPDIASAYTPTEVPCNPPPSPEPSAVQLLPSHLATLVAGLPPAVVNAPPAYTLLPDT